MCQDYIVVSIYIVINYYLSYWSVIKYYTLLDEISKITIQFSDDKSFNTA